MADLPERDAPTAGRVPDSRTEDHFGEFKQPYNEAQAVAEANRCLYCEDAPCIQACPTGIDIPTFIRKIATGNVRGSARTIFESNIFGMSCARVCPVEVLCEGDCVYEHMELPPIHIGKLQRYATDIAFEQGWEYFRAGEDTGYSVGLVGGGAASLACAHELRRYGHACTIYEKRPVLGGLNTTGVAPYKMKADRAVEEVDWILSIGGIDVQTEKALGEDLSWSGLEQEHDALFVGLGLGPDKWLEKEGEELDGVEGGVDLIERLKLGEIDVRGVRRALVVGGGNTAIDCVRQLCGLGVEDVTMVYRGSESDMSGYDHEWECAKLEGGRARWHTQPTGYVTDGGRVTGLKCIELDERREPLEGTDHAVPADLVLLAIGQRKLGHLVEGLEGVEMDRGRLLVDEDGATGRPGVYAGGDCANGGMEVVNAAAEGKRAAQAIDRYLHEGAT